MQKRLMQKQFVRMLALSLAICLIGGGLALFYQWHQGPTPGQASSDNVVGPPSLPASMVDSIFRSLGSPMVGTGQAVEAASRAANIDDAFALAVWWTETNDGAAGVGLADRNPGSVRGSTGYPSAYDGYTIYPSYTAAVNYWFPMLKRVYIDRGLTTVYAISHPYVGTSTSYLWASKVTSLMNRYRSEAPAPTPTPKPTLAPGMQRFQQAQISHAQQQGTNSSVPTVVATVQPQQQQQRSQAAASGLGETAKMFLVLFNLLFALALGLWAWSVSRRYAGLPAPRIQPQPIGNLWEDLRASQQRPSAFFGQHSLSGLLGNTEGLPVGVNTPYTGLLAVNAPNTDMLGATNPLQPAYRATSVGFSSGNFAAWQTPFQVSQTPQLTPAFGRLPFETPTPAFNGQPSFSSSSFAGAELPSFNASPSTEQLSFDAPDPAGVEQLSFDAPAPAFASHSSPFATPVAGYAQTASQSNRPIPTGQFAPGALHRTRLQPDASTLGQPWSSAEAPVRQPQFVGAASSGGRSNGLLSRYREMQEREG